MRYFGVFHWSTSPDGTRGTVFACVDLDPVLDALACYLEDDPAGKVTLVRMPADYL